METNVKILKTVVQKLEQVWNETDIPHYTADEDEKEITIDSLRRDIKYSIDMLNTIIEIETKNTGGGGIHLG